MRLLVFSTDGIAETERFTHWGSLVSNGLIGFRVERNKDEERPFNGRLVGFSGGPVARSRCRADGHASFRE
jgi:hypothetical protein